jgi:hypothetical protein
MGIFFLAPPGAGVRGEALEEARVDGSNREAQAVESGIVATSRPVPVLLRNSRRFTSFFFERADIGTYPRRRSSSVTGVRIIRRTTGRASAEMPVEKPFSRLRETLAEAAKF